MYVVVTCAAQNVIFRAQWHTAVSAVATKGDPMAYQHVQAATLSHVRPPEVLQRDCAVGADESDPVVVQHLSHNPVSLCILGGLTNELQEATEPASGRHCATS